MQWTILGSGEQQFIPYIATTTLDLNEVVPARMAARFGVL